MWTCEHMWYNQTLYVGSLIDTHTPIPTHTHWVTVTWILLGRARLIVQPFGSALINTSLWNPEDTVNICRGPYQPALSWRELQAPHDSWALYFLNAFATADNFTEWPRRKQFLLEIAAPLTTPKCRPGLLFGLDMSEYDTLGFVLAPPAWFYLLQWLIVETFTAAELISYGLMSGVQFPDWYIHLWPEGNSDITHYNSFLMDHCGRFISEAAYRTIQMGLKLIDLSRRWAITHSCTPIQHKA